MTGAIRFIGLLPPAQQFSRRDRRHPAGAPADPAQPESRDRAAVVFHRMPAAHVKEQQALEILAADIVRGSLERTILFQATASDQFAPGTFDAIAKLFAMKPRLELALARRALCPTIGSNAFAQETIRDPDMVPSLLRRHLAFVRARAVFPILETRAGGSGIEFREDLPLIAAITAREIAALPGIRVSAHAEAPPRAKRWRAERRLLAATGADRVERLAHGLSGIVHLFAGGLSAGQWLRGVRSEEIF